MVGGNERYNYLWRLPKNISLEFGLVCLLQNLASFYLLCSQTLACILRSPVWNPGLFFTLSGLKTSYLYFLFYSQNLASILHSLVSKPGLYTTFSDLETWPLSYVLWFQILASNLPSLISNPGLYPTFSGLKTVGQRPEFETREGICPIFSSLKTWPLYYLLWSQNVASILLHWIHFCHTAHS